MTPPREAARQGPSAVRGLGRLARLATTKPFLAVALLTTAAAAVTLTYTNTSTVTTSVTPPPIQFLAGGDAGPAALSDYVTAYTISTNKTHVATTLKGVPEATLTIDSFFQLTNVDDASHAYTISTPQLSNAYLAQYTIEIYDATSTLRSTMNLTAASPTTGSLSLAAGATDRAKVTLRLGTGAGADNLALTSALTLAVTP